MINGNALEKLPALWDRCVAFHGHSCGGLAIGYKAALLAKHALNLHFSEDEEIVCVSENDACGIDAIQVILGCTAGKGNLLFRLRGKQAFSFFNRKNKTAIRLVLKPDQPAIPDKAERLTWLLHQEPADLFTIQTPAYSLPEQARLFQTLTCPVCGEQVAENMVRLENALPLCLDCYSPYSRFAL